MALDAAILAEHQAASVKPWLTSIGAACDEWDATNQDLCPYDLLRRGKLGPDDKLYVCRRGEAEIWMHGVMLPTYANGRIVSGSFVLGHVHGRRSGTGWAPVLSRWTIA